MLQYYDHKNQVRLNDLAANCRKLHYQNHMKSFLLEVALKNYICMPEELYKLIQRFYGPTFHLIHTQQGKVMRYMSVLRVGGQ